MYDRLLTFLWYSLLLTPFICVIHPLWFKFYLTSDIKTMYRYSFSSIIEVFFYMNNIYSRFFFGSKWTYFTGNVFPEHSLILQNFRTRKMNLIFSRFSRTRGNSRHIHCQHSQILFTDRYFFWEKGTDPVSSIKYTKSVQLSQSNVLNSNEMEITN